MMATAFTLRPLERTAKALDQDVFRVHLSAKEIKSLGLATGDIIQLSNGTTFHGYAIAWLAQQTNPGNKPIAKVTDLLRERYELALTDSVFIEKARNVVKPLKAIEVSLTDSPEITDMYESAEELNHYVSEALAKLDIIVPGCTFDVQRDVTKNIPRIPKLRAIVQELEPVSTETYRTYFGRLKTQLTIVNRPSKTEVPIESATNLHVNSHGVGGLSDHFKTINKILSYTTSANYALMSPRLSGPQTFLIHGTEGCGKSLLLERLAQCPWRRVFRMDQDWTSSNRKTGPGALCKDVFEEARENQPSLILMDDLDKTIQKAEALVSSLQLELQKLEGSQVVVAAATRSLYDIDTRLRTASSFKTKLEIFPPNVRQREDILRQIIGPEEKTVNIDFVALADRSHGYVSRDLNDLCILARNQRKDHLVDALENLDNPLSRDTLDTMDFLTQEDFDAVIDEVRPTVLLDSVLEVPKVRWTDIAGMDRVRKLFEDMTVRPYKNPDLYKKFPHHQSRKGVLLYGPPGCAKTLIAQAVATESNQNFLAVKGSELIRMYVGESERAIRDVFRRARAAKPCIIFFDEIDSIGKSREKSQDSGLNVVTTLLNEMDGIEALRDVFIIGATNRPDILDSALIRKGRFDAHIHIGLPNEDARRQVFEIHTRKQPLAADVDLNTLASRTNGSSGADISGLCAVAVDMALSDCEDSPDIEPEICMSHFEHALEQHVPHTDEDHAKRYENWRPGKSLLGVQ